MENSEIDDARLAIDAIEVWITSLATAERLGAEVDEPEGARYIQISDTLAQDLAGCLEELRDIAMTGLMLEKNRTAADISYESLKCTDPKCIKHGEFNGS